jgi:cyclophilin family peptidyl-prolyl cis-trans isomerase
MKKLLTASILLTFMLGCSGDKKPATTANSNKPEVKTGVTPVADPEIAVIEMENPAYGTIKMELYSNIAPKMVERFKELARAGFYNGTTFHRVNDIVIQGGDPTGTGTGNSGKPNVPAEFSDVPYERGTLGAARTNDPNTANCQFFISMKRYPGWDKNYTVFGKVIDGMNNADIIRGVPKNGERPIDPVKMKSVTIVPREEAK